VLSIGTAFRQRHAAFTIRRSPPRPLKRMLL
jgi:hypothetical protein